MNDNLQPAETPRSLAVELAILLEAFNPQISMAWKLLYAEPADRSEATQLCWINRFWRDQLAHLELTNASLDTKSARECLLDQITFHDWLRLFQTHVMPFVIQYQLPIQRQIQPVEGQTPPWADIAKWSGSYGW